jgi:enamine deaminase RidA (YjgF/YER057c/UK114 family)
VDDLEDRLTVRSAAMGGPVIERIDPFDGAPGFSLVVRAGSTVYTAGAFGIDPDTLEISPEVEVEVRQAFANRWAWWEPR